MAHAFAFLSEIFPTGDGFTIRLAVLFAGRGTRASGDRSVIEVSVAASEAPGTIQSKLSQAVRDKATALGYPVTAANVTLPSLQKG